MANEQGHKADEAYIARLNTHLEHTKEFKFYALKRIDLLIISISGAGLYAVFEILRFIQSSGKCQDTLFIKMSGILFAVAVIINFFSQWAGYAANDNEARSTDLTIRKEKELNESVRIQIQDKIDKVDIRVNRYNSWTTFLNVACSTSMVLAIVVLIYFNLVTF